MDLKEIKQIIELMKKYSVTEFEWEKEGCRVRLKRIEAELPAQQVNLPSALTVQAAQSQLRYGSASTAPEKPSPAPQQEVEIRAPMVGTFYRAPAPDAAPYVEVGSKVDEDTVVCIIEAMKVMNEIKAEVKGTITAILVENGQPVEYGQPLFRVLPS